MKLKRLLRKMMHDMLMFIMPKSITSKLLTCEQVSHIIAENNQITLLMSLKLKMHLLICQDCTDYSQQLNIISLKVNQIDSESSNTQENPQSATSKEDLIKKFSSK